MHQIRFIHTADLHLDSPFKGLSRVPEEIFNSIQNSTFASLDRLIEEAIAKQVSFVLITGDLFDHDTPSLKAQIYLRNALRKLQDYQIHVYISYGNHDFINGNRYPVNFPDNVHLFQDEKVRHFTYMRDDMPLAAIYGFSYETRAVHENKTKDYVLQDRSIPFHLAMLHGSIVSNTDHDVYAPFHLSDMTEKEFDYWALGHIHKRQQLSQNPPILYSGNIQGRNRKESGEKGCYYVEMTEIETRISFIPLQTILFDTKMIDISACVYPYELEPVIYQAIEQQEKDCPQLLELQLTSENKEHYQWEKEGLIQDIIDLINETDIQKERWHFIYTYTLQINQDLLEQGLAREGHFAGELIHHADDMSVMPYMEELYHHKEARKYLQPILQEEEANIKQEAKQYLLNEFLKRKDE